MREKERGGSERGSSVASCPIWTSLSCSSSNEEDKQQTLTTCYSVAMAIKCKSILTLSMFFFVLTLCDKKKGLCIRACSVVQSLSFEVAHRMK